MLSPRRMSLLRGCLAVFLAAAFCAPAAAKEAEPVGGDEALEHRVMGLAEQLRCLVCQNQTIADSHADLAEDLRNQIRDQLRGGATEQQVKAYMVARYGDFVLYKPPLKATTIMLWSAPAVLGFGGVLWLVLYLRRRAARLEAAGDEEEEGLDNDAIGEGGP